jgi:hypothetical protein
VPIWDVEPGDNSRAAGVARLYADGADPASGLVLGTDGAATAVGVPLGCWTNNATDQGMITHAFDPAAMQGGIGAVAGTLYLTKLPVRSPVTLSTLWFQVTTLGTGGVAGQNWAGLYAPDGTRLSAVGCDAQFGVVGSKSAALPAPVAVAPPFVWGALLFNATGMPQFSRGSTSGSSHSIGTAAALSRFCTNGTGLTTLPTSIVPASNSLTGSLTFYMGAS